VCKNAQKSCENWALDLMKIGARTNRYFETNGRRKEEKTTKTTAGFICQRNVVGYVDPVMQGKYL
jgi:hypothetical protein